LSRTDLHPDHLLARRRAGQLSPEECALLDRHASRCATCAFEIAAGQDFDRDLAAPTDPAALASITAGVQRRLDLPEAALAAALSAARPAAPVAPAPRRPSPAALAPVAPPPARPVVAAPLAVQAAPPATTPRVEAPARTRRRGRPVAAHAPPSLAARDGARSLFEQAVAARRGGQHALAASLFEQLQHRYGDSEEASISQIALGRLWLDRLGQPARALVQFESYLAARRRGESREEAMVGRAAALERLGRTASAREAWEAVRDAFPGSVSARRAAVRIDALR
jgi:TolA-binding protein